MTRTRAVESHRGFYGASSIEKKLRVASLYRQFQETLRGRHLVRAVAKKARVSKDLVRKVAMDLLYGEMVDYVLHKYRRNPLRSISEYQDKVYNEFGVDVSESTIRQFFLTGYSKKKEKARFDTAEKVGYYFYFVNAVNGFPVHRLKFCDEKLLKETQFIDSRVRQYVDGSFQNYTIVGFCGIDRNCPPISYTVVPDKHDSYTFFLAIATAINQGFLRCGDVLVMDNKSFHLNGENEGLAEFLWNRCQIAVLTLPKGCPELNPMKVIWRSLMSELPKLHIDPLRERHAVATAASYVLGSMTHRSVKAAYREANYLY